MKAQLVFLHARTLKAVGRVNVAKVLRSFNDRATLFRPANRYVILRIVITEFFW
jgi:hypothetical protein